MNGHEIHEQQDGFKVVKYDADYNITWESRLFDTYDDAQEELVNLIF